MKIYRSTRIARHHLPFRERGTPPPPPTYQVVYGYPKDCKCPRRIAIIGDAPGMEEDQFGVPFLGRPGEELDRFLDTYNIEPDECFFTNISRTFTYGHSELTQSDIETWEPMLQEELNAARPAWIIAMGRGSTRYFLGDVDMEAVHGIPFLITLPWLDNGRGGRVVVIPSYHTSAGIQNTEMQANIAYDFAQVAATLGGRLTPRLPEMADLYPNPDYRDLTDSATDISQIIDSLSGGSKSEPLIVAVDTEGLPGKPWGLSYSIEPGKAFVIRKVHSIAMRMFYEALMDGIRQGRIHIVLHNSLHDLMVLRELGIPIPDGSFTDTMVLSYNLCIEPQGLKPLSFRHAGMVMDAYTDIVQDAQDQIAVEYYELIEALVSGGIEYESPEQVTWCYTVKHKGKGTSNYEYAEAPTVEEANQAIRDWKEQWNVKCTKPKKLVLPASGPISVGPFAYIQSYTILDRDKTTGQLRERTKRPQQIDYRVMRALSDLREGKITAADLRKRWENTDELIVSTVEEIIGEMREADLDDVPLERAVFYAARDADATRRVYPVLKERHSAMGLERVGVIDHAIIPMVDRMQETGIQVNIPYFKALSKDLERRMIAVQQRIKDEFGIWINPNSGDQVADVLFRPVEDGGYGLVATKQTKGTTDKETGEVKKRRGSTQDKVLEGLRNEHPIIPLILEYRGLNKAKTSFCDVAIRKAVYKEVPLYDEFGEPTGEVESGWFVHCRFRITRVSSGRLSATNPNLMAVMGGDLGQEIREGYVAGDGYTFVEWDLNQVEMRVMASEADDKFLISMFMTDEDVHTGTADKMFNLHLKRPYNKKQVDKVKHRDPAKRTGFGVITGIQGPGLVDQMRLQGIIVTEDEAKTWILDWLAACPAVPVYMEACKREARAFGFVRDWAGRIRYLPGIHSPFRNVREEAGRQSHSHKIQAGAQEIMKIGMHNIWVDVIPYWIAKGKYIVPILQVHDALMLRIKGFNAEELEELDAQVRAAMFTAAPPGFRIPLDAGNGSAPTWGQLEH